MENFASKKCVNKSDLKKTSNCIKFVNCTTSSLIQKKKKRKTRTEPKVEAKEEGL